MIRRSIVALFITLILCVQAFAETSTDNGQYVYVPDYQLEKIYQTPAGDIFAVRDSLKRVDGFVELWARIIPKDLSEKTLTFWNREKVAITSNTSYSHLKLHFYCQESKASIPATYQFDDESQLIYSLVVMMDDPFSTKDKPVTSQLNKLACSGKLDWLNNPKKQL